MNLPGDADAFGAEQVGDVAHPRCCSGVRVRRDGSREYILWETEVRPGFHQSTLLYLACSPFVAR